MQSPHWTAVRDAFTQRHALDARMATWAQRYAQWREARKLLDILDKRGAGGREELRAKVEQLRIESQEALAAVQLRLGGERAGTQVRPGQGEIAQGAGRRRVSLAGDS